MKDGLEVSMKKDELCRHVIYYLCCDSIWGHVFEGGSAQLPQGPGARTLPLIM